MLLLKWGLFLSLEFVVWVIDFFDVSLVIFVVVILCECVCIYVMWLCEFVMMCVVSFGVIF